MRSNPTQYHLVDRQYETYVELCGGDGGLDDTNVFVRSKADTDGLRLCRHCAFVRDQRGEV